MMAGMDEEQFIQATIQRDKLVDGEFKEVESED